MCNNCNGFGNNWWWIIILFLLGGFGCNNCDEPDNGCGCNNGCGC